ncbi:response regulator [Mucilaginibacter lappiensis]|uniref:response regulator n=1 Tax=Mucilaginibacter lappiensis TaxID=354630 RepID=UPI003D1E8BA6
METIIIQDTEKDILDILTTALELENFKVFTVMDDETNLLGMIAKFRPHVVILDYRLEGTDCIRICREIKARHAHLPVVAMSCNSNINEVYDREGFDDYIEKPFDLDHLYEVLRKHIPKHEKHSQVCANGQPDIISER